MDIKLLFHLIPFLIILIASYVAYSFLSNDDKIYYLSKYITGTINDNVALKNLYIIYNAHKIIYAIQAVIYFTLILLLLKKHRQRIEEYFSSTKGINLNWLYIFNILLLIGSINGIAANFIPIETISSQDQVLITLCIIFTLFYGATGILGLRQKPIYTKFNDSNNAVELTIGKDYEQNKKRLKIELLNYFEIEKPYLKNDLKISDISKTLNSNRTYISKLINEEFSSNFCNFVNQFRIKEAKKIMKDSSKNDLSLESIADLSGFSSFTSFFRVFKKNEQQTPSNFRKQNQK